MSVTGVLVFDAAYVGAGLERVDRAWLRVRDGAIVEIGAGDPPQGSVRIGGVAIPGLVDAHVHLALEGTADVVATLAERDHAALRDVVRRNASAQLSSGVTTVRDLGARGDVVAELVREGVLVPPASPHVVVGSALSAPDGHGNFLARHASTAEQFLAAADEAIDAGARVVKVFATGGVITAGTVPGAVQMPLEALAAVVEHAHARGIRVAAHAHGEQGIANAVAAGVDSVEHASFLGEDLLARVPGGTWLVSTLIATERFVAADERGTASEETLAKILAHVEHERRALRLAVTRPERLVAGTDAGTTFNPHGGGMQEQARLLEAAGLAPLEVLRAMTVRAAALLDEPAGALETGRRADVLVLDGDPGADLGALARAREVVLAGVLIGRSPRARQRGPATGR